MLLATLPLLAVFCLVGRPIADAALNIPPDPAEVTIVGLPDGSHLCYVASDCESVLVTSFGIDRPDTTIALGLGGTRTMTAWSPQLAPEQPTLGIALPPPRLAVA